MADIYEYKVFLSPGLPAAVEEELNDLSQSGYDWVGSLQVDGDAFVVMRRKGKSVGKSRVVDLSAAALADVNDL
jgi:hypothetical protein